MTCSRSQHTRIAIFVAILMVFFKPFSKPLHGGGQPSALPISPSPSEKSSDHHPVMTSLSSLPQEAQSSISAALGRDLPGYEARAKRGQIEVGNPGQKLAVNFSAHGVAVRRASRSSGKQLWKIALRAYGYGDALKQVHAVSPTAKFNRVEYRRRELTEWYVNGPLGVEQGITIHRRPGHSGGLPLTIAMTVEGGLSVAVDADGTGLTLTNREGQPELRYTGFSAYDAQGQKLPAWLELKGTELRLQADDARAHYPVVLDPDVQTADLTASDGVPHEEVGDSVALSGDTVVAGAPGCLGCGFVGAAYVFTRPATGWANMTQAAKLTASDGVADNQFGFAVSISGQTIVVGSHGDNDGRGAAYVFVEPATGWTSMTETAKLTGSDSVPGDLVGRSVAISGNTVVAGAPQAAVNKLERLGAAYVFVEPANGWANMTQTAKLTASGGVSYGEMGYSVGIDGNTVVAGAPNAHGGHIVSAGTVYLFDKPENGWTNMTQTAALTGSDAVLGDRVGNFVAISGNTVVAGAPLATPGSKLQQGAAYLFVRPAKGWSNTTQTAKLTSSDGSRRGFFGRSVAISGNEVVVGAPYQTVNSEVGEGAVYEFVEPASGWVDMTETLELDAASAGEHSLVGGRIGIDGSTVVTGSLGQSKRGSALVFLNSQ
jgi:uncharacterized protein (DUF2345 family)